MLIQAITLLGAVVLIGLALGGLYLLLDEPPKGLDWKGILHGLGGAAGLALLIMALLKTPPSAHVSAALIGAAFATGLYILSRHLLRRSISLGIVASHGLLAIVGYTLLVTYLTMLH
jgi:hypothetical protein